eukprot:tig00020816_g14150.t1
MLGSSSPSTMAPSSLSSLAHLSPASAWTRTTARVSPGTADAPSSLASLASPASGGAGGDPVTRVGASSAQPPASFEILRSMSFRGPQALGPDANPRAPRRDRAAAAAWRGGRRRRYRCPVERRDRLAGALHAPAEPRRSAGPEGDDADRGGADLGREREREAPAPLADPGPGPDPEDDLDDAEHEQEPALALPSPACESFWAACLLVDVVGSVALAERLTEGGGAHRGADALHVALNATFARVLRLARARGGAPARPSGFGSRPRRRR